MSPPAAAITRLLQDMESGHAHAAAELLPLVYDELRRLAAQFLQRERVDHTLEATALVHEAFLRLVGSSGRWQDRAHFYRVAAEAMRRVLVNHARDHKRLKRGGGVPTVRLGGTDPLGPDPDPDLLALDEALTRLAAVDPRKVQITELRYFGGFTVEETARILDISESQVKRDWTFARAWLLRDLRRGEST